MLTLRGYLLFQLIVLNCDYFVHSTLEINPDGSWHPYSEFGQISAITTDSRGNIYVFHRGDRIWERNAFSLDERYTQIERGPSKVPTIAVLNPNGTLITQTGENKFYLPHGLTIDHEDNLWITDVALHQVVKYPPLNFTSPKTELAPPSLVLGKTFEPGNDLQHFCKPTSVAVDSRNGDFFVADGYCNSRIIKYDAKGNVILTWGRKIPYNGKVYEYSMVIPHSISLDEKNDHIFVADRENSRVLCFDLRNGKFMHQLPFKHNVYALTYSPKTEKLLVVTGYTDGAGAVISESTWLFDEHFKPPNAFKGAHDVAVSPDGRYAYVIELTESVLWRFEIGTNSSSKVHGISGASAAVSAENATGLASRELLEIKTPPVKIDESSAIAQNNADENNSDFNNVVSSLKGNQVAATVITFIAILAIVAVSCHVFRRRGKAQNYEMRGLILQDYDDP